MSRKIAILLIIALGSQFPAFGQVQKGSITVTVQTADETRLPGVTVSAESTETLSRRTGFTGEDGAVTLTALDPAANYVVTTFLEQFNGSRHVNVRVRAGQNTPIRVSLTLNSFGEELLVTGDSPLVDITSTTTGQEITLELTEALPTARSYQDYLQLVPGVQAAIGTSSNPASRSGVNYADLGGVVGSSTDNFYFFDGINVTDPLTGNFGANLNTEIIQEQSVVTGGITSEFVGATGLISNVITKSGGNSFSGSINYYFQDDSLVADDEHEEDAAFSSFDTAATLGGPIIADKAWFFASYRNLNREDDVISKDEGVGLLRTVENDSDQFFGKVTWALSTSDLLSGVFLSDPTDISGTRDNNNSNARDRATEQGGERYSLNYSRVWGRLVLDAAYSDHEGDLNQVSSIPEARNTVAFRRGDPFTQAEEEQGGWGSNNLQFRGSEAFKASMELLVGSRWGEHTVKFGGDVSETRVFQELNFIDKMRHVSISDRYLGQGIRARELEGGGFSTGSFTVNSNSDFGGLIRTIDQHQDRDFFYGLLDTNRDGSITQEEALDSLVFGSNEGNPTGQINYNRTAQTVDGPQEVNSKSRTFYLQDNWQWNRWSVNLGVRSERWEHFASTGASIFTFDWEYAPRVSIAYDLGGKGRRRLSAYYGRYFDPARNDTTQFAGSLSGRALEEQVFVGDQWVTYRNRGGPSQQNGFFAPNAKTPYTDEFQLGYKVDLGRNQSFEANLIRRETRDILEDFAPTVYLTGEDYPGPIDHPDSLFLGFDYFGFSEDPNANFIISTLPGAKRDWEALELVYRKRLSNHWQMIASYQHADGEGNNNSDAFFDFAGDFIQFDPRAPNNLGTQAGLVEDLLKVAGSYQWDSGFTVGGSYRWNSGIRVNRTAQLFGRNNPLTVPAGEEFEFAGITNNWVAPDSVGTVENPSYGLLDLRLSYLWNIAGRYEADFFVDVFNVLDEQEAVQIQDRVSGGDGIGFEEGLRFNDPQRFFLGARLRF